MKGLRFAVFAAIISGFSIYINKFAVTGTNPLAFTATKNFAVGLMIVSVLLITRKWQLIAKLTKKDWLKLLAVGVIGGSVPFYLFFTGLSQTSAVNAAILQKTLVIWVAILAVPFLKERLNLFQVIAIALLFYSNIMVGGLKGFKFSQGELMILAATIFWAIETVIVKKVLKTVDVNLVMAARMGFGSIILLTFAGSPQPLSPSLLITALILFAYVSVWYRALKYAPAVEVSAVLVASTLITNVLSAKIIVDQNAVMFAGLLLLLLSKKLVSLVPLQIKS